MLLSGTSVNHRVETEQSKDIIPIKFDPVLLKLLFYAPHERASFCFRSSGSWLKSHSVALNVAVTYFRPSKSFPTGPCQPAHNKKDSFQVSVG